MYQNKNIYKNNLLLYFYIIIVIHILNVSSVNISIESFKDNNNYDITVIYRITNMSYLMDTNAGFTHEVFYHRYKKSYTIELHSKTNEILINDNFTILQLNENELFNNGLFKNNDRLNVSYDLNNWGTKSITLTGENCEVDNNYYNIYTQSSINDWNITTPRPNNKIRTKCFDVFNFKYYMDYDLVHNSFNGESKYIFNLYWLPDKDQTCLTIMYIHTSSSKMYITMKILSENNIIASRVLNKDDDIKKLIITDIKFIKDQNYTLSFEVTTTYTYREEVDYWVGSSKIWFGLFNVLQCSNDDEEYVRIVSMNNFNISEHVNQLRYAPIKKHVKINTCLNGGFMERNNLMCICPPGFIGQFCEKGCGPNFYGNDCNSVCSLHSTKMCRGILICTKYGCTCSAGLTGRLCDKDCISGTYGANCSQICSPHCYNNECNQYTGICSYGCSSGYIKPYCIEKYPYLINPPTELNEEYEKIEIELNFQPNNVKGGNKNIKLKYYQLYYKPSIENNFINSELKIINESNLNTIEIIHNLEPDTEYTIGVLVITDDGNFNENDIVFGKYRTSCRQPKITDYNIRLISGFKNVNISWDSRITKREECKIIEYVLTLTFKQLQNKISGVQKIISHSNSGHIINDLFPGYQYGVTLTPKTIKGSLNSSPVYPFSPLITENDIEIGDITTFTNNNMITVFWKLKNSQQLNVEFNEPVTYIIRYKINRILSCSTNEIETNWTSIKIYNKTTYEIINIEPNSQYSIQVLIFNKDIIDVNPRENIVNTLTPPSLPATKPFWDQEHPILVTNNSVFVQWNVDPKNCSYLNGFFSKFYITLKNSIDNTLDIIKTNQNYIEFNNLNANTTYELKVFIVTNIGYNNDQFLFTKFTTKNKNLNPVDNFSVYKKSLKNRMVGLRWSYAENILLNGFLLSINEGTVLNTNNVTVIPPIKCTAWPEYYCYTFYNLTQSNNYKIKIQPMSLDYPEGGKVSSVSFNNVEGIPDAPANLKLNEIGNTTITLQWDIPWTFNGLLKQFIINIEETEAIDMNMCCGSTQSVEIIFEEELPTYNYTLMDLKPGSTYSVGVLAVSKSLWYSSPARISVTTLI